MTLEWNRLIKWLGYILFLGYSWEDFRLNPVFFSIMAFECVAVVSFLVYMLIEWIL